MADTAKYPWRVTFLALKQDRPIFSRICPICGGTGFLFADPPVWVVRTIVCCDTCDMQGWLPQPSAG